MSLTLQAVAVSLAPAINGFKALRDLVKGEEAKAQVTELYDIIIAAQASALESYINQTSMINRIHDLEEQMRNKEAWEAEKKRYELKSPFAGSMVYALKESMKSGEEAHYLCTRCYKDGKPSILQNGKGKDLHTSFVCPVCGTELRTPMRGPIAPEYAEKIVTR